MKNNDVNEKLPVEPSVIELSKQGRRQLRARNFAKACSLFTQGLEREPGNPYLLSGLGDASREMGRFDEAIDCYTRLLQVDEGNLFALRGLGDCYKKRNRHDEAILVWQRYLQLRPRDKHVMSRIADSAKILLQFERAEDMYRQILEIDAEDRFALTGLADLEHRLGKDREAIGIYEKILALDGNSIHILTILGKLCWRISDFDLSETYFRRALKIDPLNPYALYGLGNCHRWHRRYQEAVDVWEKILAHSEGTQALHTRMGDAYCHIGQFKQAEEAYQKAVSFGRDPFAMAGLISLAVAVGDLKTAIDTFYDLVVADGDPLYQLDLLCKRFVRCRQEDQMKTLFRLLVSEDHGGKALESSLSAALRQWC